MNRPSHHPQGTQRNSGELSRLISAAVVNQTFCRLLLTDPALALAAGYNGEAFCLPAEEQAIILTIRATCLTDFAKQLTQARNGNGNGRKGS